jgi:hypothetical protein
MKCAAEAPIFFCGGLLDDRLRHVGERRRSPIKGRGNFRDIHKIIEEYSSPSRVRAFPEKRIRTTLIQTTRNYLDAPKNAVTNVVIWPAGMGEEDRC